MNRPIVALMAAAVLVALAVLGAWLLATDSGGPATDAATGQDVATADATATAAADAAPPAGDRGEPDGPAEAPEVGDGDEAAVTDPPKQAQPAKGDPPEQPSQDAPPPADEPAEPSPAKKGKARPEADVEEALETLVTVAADSQSFTAVAESIGESAGIEVLVDPDLDRGEETEVSLQLRDVTARVALLVLARFAGAEMSVEGDHVVLRPKE